jgi:hypothetical protein
MSHPDEDHGLTVEPVDRAIYARPHRIQACSETCDTGDTGVVTDLRDLRHVPLGQLADEARNGNATVDNALHRITPNAGHDLPVAAFQSSI